MPVAQEVVAEQQEQPVLKGPAAPAGQAVQEVQAGPEVQAEQQGQPEQVVQLERPELSAAMQAYQSPAMCR